MPATAVPAAAHLHPIDEHVHMCHLLLVCPVQLVLASQVPAKQQHCGESMCRDLQWGASTACLIDGLTSQRCFMQLYGV